MKKNYITPNINLSEASIEFNICNASIVRPGDVTQGKDIPDTRDPFVVGSKNRFYGDSDDSWE